MQITVKLFATLRVGRFAAAPKEYPAGTRIADVIGDLEIPDAQIGIIMLNGRHGESCQILAEGDSLSLFPLVGGG
jgi:molybdopterin converting factor small subunit